MHRVRGRRGLALVRALWHLRDEIATDRDVTPGRILPDSAIVAAAMAAPTDRRTLLSTKGFHGRGAKRYAARWVDALTEAAGLSEAELPQRAPRGDGPPPPRAWVDKNPTAAKRLSQARAELAELSERIEVPVENLLSPDTLRRVLWSPPESGSAEDVAAALRAMGAREWQIGQVGPILVAAIADAG
jgi:ribonuclease D